MKSSDKFRKSYRPPMMEVGHSIGMGLFNSNTYMVTLNLSTNVEGPGGGFFGLMISPEEADQMAIELKRYASICRAHQPRLQGASK